MTNVILKGIVGSTAYGLNTETSDVDRLGIYIEPTTNLVGMNPPSQKSLTIQEHGTEEDFALHELGKACYLMANGNPTVMEMLWLESYEVMDYIGEALVEMRRDFLAAARVKDAYLGYATQQFHRLVDRGRFQGSLDTRREKHARHMLRLITQGEHLWKTGELRIRLTDDEVTVIREEARMIAENDEYGQERAQQWLYSAEHSFAEPTPLPEAPDVRKINALIISARYVNFFGKKMQDA